MIRCPIYTSAKQSISVSPAPTLPPLLPSSLPLLFFLLPHSPFSYSAQICQPTVFSLFSSLPFPLLPSRGFPSGTRESWRVWVWQSTNAIRGDGHFSRNLGRFAAGNLGTVYIDIHRIVIYVDSKWQHDLSQPLSVCASFASCSTPSDLGPALQDEEMTEFLQLMHSRRFSCLRLSTSSSPCPTWFSWGCFLCPVLYWSIGASSYIPWWLCNVFNVWIPKAGIRHSYTGFFQPSLLKVCDTCILLSRCEPSA